VKACQYGGDGVGVSTQQTGLTLIELLLVISILALLLALLIPAIYNVREQSRIAYCLGNLRRIGTALNTYASDNQGFLPPGKVEIHSYAPAAGKTEHAKEVWCEFLYAYLDIPEVRGYSTIEKQLTGTCFDCPSNQASSQRLGFDYAYNAQAVIFLDGKLANIPSPSFQILVSESGWYLNSNPHNVHLVHSLMLGSPGANYLFADGHAEWSQRYHLMEPQYSPWRPYLRQSKTR